MCNFENYCCLKTIIDCDYKNVFELLLLLQHIHASSKSHFYYKLVRKNGNISEALKNGCIICILALFLKNLS